MQTAEEMSKTQQKWAEQVQTGEKQDQPKALLFMGMKFINGQEVIKDQKKGMEMVTSAAEQGDAEAQEYLGDCFKSGTGVARNFDQAFFWYQKSAEQGRADAQNKLGQMYDFQATANLETPFIDWKRKKWLPKARENRDLAIQWYRAAAAQGNSEAQTRVWSLTNSGSLYVPVGSCPDEEKKGQTIMQMTSARGVEYFVDINSKPESSCSCVML